ncbi:MAG: hypothetical protein M3Z24_13480 [Chloroflexota bacterium]|nr:hypothetical protein [Chloroflexota bacterium]
MTRSDIEAKPAWRSLPLSLRQRVQQTFGTSVARARRAWGGYAHGLRNEITAQVKARAENHY